jgi:hypothetical protein
MSSTSPLQVPAAELAAELRGDHPRGAAVRRPWRAQAPVDRRRAAAAQACRGLIAQLSDLRTPDGEPLDITLTTNGSLLARKAQALKDAGLQRVTVSLDALDDASSAA